MKKPDSEKDTTSPGEAIVEEKKVTQFQFLSFTWGFTWFVTFKVEKVEPSKIHSVESGKEDPKKDLSDQKGKSPPQ